MNKITAFDTHVTYDEVYLINVSLDDKYVAIRLDHEKRQFVLIGDTSILDQGTEAWFNDLVNRSNNWLKDVVQEALTCRH